MEFPDIEDLRIIVASYVSNDLITLINLFSLWKIPDLYKLYEEKLPTDEKIYYKMRKYIPIHIKNVSNSDITKSGIKTEKITLTIDEKISENSGHFSDNHFFKKITIKQLKPEKTEFIQNLKTETLIIAINLLKNEKLEINGSVEFFEMNASINKSKLILPEKSNLKSIYFREYDENILDFLKSGFPKKLKELKIAISTFDQLKNCNFENLNKLHISEYMSDKHSFLRSAEFITKLKLTDYAVIFSGKYDLNLLPDPETLKELKLYCKEGFLENNMRILNMYKKLELFEFVVCNDIEYFIPPTVKKLGLYIFKNFANKFSEKLFIPKSVDHISMIMPSNKNHKKLLNKILFENVGNMRCVEINFVHDWSNLEINIKSFNNFLSKLKNLETLIFHCNHCELPKLNNITDIIPKNVTTIILNGFLISCDTTKVIDFRRFRKLRWLEIGINQECDFCDPVILLPTSGFEPVHVDIKGNRNKKFKNIRGLYY